MLVAGIALDTIRGTQTGVYVGASHVDYKDLLQIDVDDAPVYQSTGISGNMLSNRISYVFDLKGTSITMDTACSSSLAALHVACQSLQTGENTQVVVGGAHIVLSADDFVGMSMIKYEPCPAQLCSKGLMGEGCLERKVSATHTTPGVQATDAEKGLPA